jgi:fumarate reductase subunit D
MDFHTKNPQVWLLLMAACLVLATLAPVAVLVG